MATFGVGLIRDTELMDILEKPEEYIDSEKYFSWGQYFADPSDK